MEHHKETLFLPDYWFENPSSEWSATGYFMELINKISTTDRRTGHQKLTEDLEALYVIYIDDPNTKKKISSLSNSLKNPSKACKDIFNEFWEKHSKNLRAKALSNQIKENNLKVAVNEKAKETLTEEIQNLKPSSCTRSKKRSSESKQGESSKPNKKQYKFKDATFNKELDGVFIGNSSLSIGTLIKNSAIEIHEKYIKGVKITPRQRKIMTNGSSSILDLSDESYASQRSLFSGDEWTQLTEHFNTVLKLNVSKLDEKVTDNIEIIFNTLCLSGDLKSCLKLTFKEAELANTDSSRIGLMILGTFIQIKHKYPHMLIKPSTKKVTEYDYFRCIWSPLFEILFPPEDQVVRIKSGESINPHSTKSKGEIYADSEFLKAFKIDFRFLIDKADGTEIDAGAGECALNDDDEKAISDEGKLTREGKDALDKIIDIVPEDLGEYTTWLVQTAGSHCSLSTIHLENPGLYVVKHRHSFNIPFSELCLRNCGNSIQWLLKLREQLLELHRLVIKYSTTANCSNDTSFNRKGKQHANPKASFIRDTYYTPPSNRISKLPLFMYGPPPPFNNMPARHSATTTDVEPSSNREVPDDDLFTSECDMYGYRGLKDGRFYNVFIKKICNTHPFKV